MAIMGIDYDKTGMYVKFVPIRWKVQIKSFWVKGGGGLNKTLFVPDHSKG